MTRWLFEVGALMAKKMLMMKLMIEKKMRVAESHQLYEYLMTAKKLFSPVGQMTKKMQRRMQEKRVW
jgi:hypothetical protein